VARARGPTQDALYPIRIELVSHREMLQDLIHGPSPIRWHQSPPFRTQGVPVGDGLLPQEVHGLAQRDMEDLLRHRMRQSPTEEAGVGKGGITGGHGEVEDT
jgi:hypothetical protein